jgi:hypothetical protein
MRVSIAYTFLGTVLVLSVCGTAFAQDTNFSTGPQYLLQGSSLFARSISTPTLSLPAPALEAGAANATENLVAGAENQTAVPPTHPDANLFPIYYGPAPSSVIEINFSPAPSANQLPPSILDDGVWQITTAQALRERGHGVTLAEAGVHSKAGIRHATRVYTNADVERLHGGS